MVRTSIPVALSFLVLALSGCLAADDPDPIPLDEAAAKAEMYADISALLADLPCEADVGEGDSANIMEIARDPLDEVGYVASGEADRHGDLVLVARYPTGGFNVVDVSNASAPVEIATWDPEVAGERALDIKFVPDGSAAVLGGDNGIRLMDLRDPSEPVEEHRLAFSATQAHMVTTFAVDNVSYVAVAKGDGQDLPIYEIAGDPGNRTFELASSPHISSPTRLASMHNDEDLVRAHDSFFFVDPIDDRPTLWVANVWDGIVALDVSDPAQPEEILRIPNLRPQYTHTVQTIVTEDERRITISVSEAGLNTMRAFDTTDLANPVLLSEWSVTNEAQPQHNLQVVPPYVYVAHYGEGVFVFELDDIISGTPAPIARLASTGGPPEADNPTVTAIAATGLFDGAWDVLLHDGLMYVTDGALRIVGFGCLDVADDAMTSTG